MRLAALVILALLAAAPAAQAQDGLLPQAASALQRDPVFVHPEGKGLTAVDALIISGQV